MKRYGAEDNSGFALVIALWTLILIGWLIAHLVSIGRSEAQISANEHAAAVAEAAADGGIHAAAFHLVDGDAKSRWQADGGSHQLRIGQANVSVQMWNEDGLVNPNLASHALLENLFRALGYDGGKASRLAGGIESWRDPAAQFRTGGLGPDDYRAQGKSYGPPGAPIEDLDELARILEFGPDVLAVVRPHLSLWTQLEYPVPSTADPVVARALDELDRVEGSPRVPGVVKAGRFTVRIRATAATPAGGHFVRQAVLRVDPSFPDGYQVLAWEQMMGGNL